MHKRVARSLHVRPQQRSVSAGPPQGKVLPQVDPRQGKEGGAASEAASSFDSASTPAPAPAAAASSSREEFLRARLQEAFNKRKADEPRRAEIPLGAHLL